MTRIAVTGLGLCCALGTGVPDAWAAVRDGEGGIRREGDRLLARARGVEAALPALAARLGEGAAGQRRLATLDRAAVLALLAAAEAWADASPPLPDPRRGGAVLGAAVGFGSFDAAYLSLYGQNAGRVHPLTVPRVMPSAAASQASMLLGLRGPTLATASACASGAHAIGLGLELLRAGRLDVALVGAAEAPLAPGVLKGWDSLRVLSPDACRPFSRDRTGIVLGEGAGMMVLEPWERARARGARIHAELAGFGMGADAADLTAPDPDGCAWALQEALRDARLPAEAIGYVNAHGTGTRLNDRVECLALRQVLGERLPRVPLTASKGASRARPVGRRRGGGGAHRAGPARGRAAPHPRMARARPGVPRGLRAGGGEGGEGGGGAVLVVRVRGAERGAGVPGRVSPGAAPPCPRRGKALPSPGPPSARRLASWTSRRCFARRVGTSPPKACEAPPGVWGLSAPVEGPGRQSLLGGRSGGQSPPKRSHPHATRSPPASPPT